MDARPPLRPPAARRLRVYAFDPAAALDLGSSTYSQATITLPWNDPSDGLLSPGPVNDYLEVIDIDPCSSQLYPPVDLMDPQLLAQDGMTPTEGDPRFHQQMVFAVIMRTIKLFERALGRRVLWAPTQTKNADNQTIYVPTNRLRVYPHALREANAYYSKGKCALLFGYFKSEQRAAGANWIFTALSHDIIVHETTHAILDGLHRRYSESTNLDSLAFHEAFADIAALFSHFQLREAVYDFIDKNSGRLDESGLLSGLASQFASGTTGRRSLRDAIDKDPDPNLLEGSTEPHERGSVLVAAVFDAFLAIYTRRTADLQRLAHAHPGGGERLHPDFVARLTDEAAKSADHVLRMCIRALDYLPPVDLRFGEFLRGVITADTDLIPDDRLNYRLAFVQAFRRRGIFPDDCLSMSPDSLLWQGPGFAMTEPDPAVAQKLLSDIAKDANELLTEGLNLTPKFTRDEIEEVTSANRLKVWLWLIQPALVIKPSEPALGETEAQARKRAENDQALEAEFKTFLAQARQVFFCKAWTLERSGAEPAKRSGFAIPTLDDFLHDWAPFLTSVGVDPDALIATAGQLAANPSKGRHSGKVGWPDFFNALLKEPSRVTEDSSVDAAWAGELGVIFRQDKSRKSINSEAGYPAVEVHSVRTTRRTGPDGQDVRQLVIEITQRRRCYFSANDQERAEKGLPLLVSKVLVNTYAIAEGSGEGSVRLFPRRRNDDPRSADRLGLLHHP